MPVKKLKYYIEVRRWQPGKGHNGFFIAGQWEPRVYTHLFKTPLDREAFVKKNRAEWEAASAPDGHPLYNIKLVER